MRSTRRQRVLRTRIGELRDDGVAVVVATHQPAFMVGLADRGVVLEGGRVAVEGGYDDVLGSPAAERLGVVQGGGR